VVLTVLPALLARLRASGLRAVSLAEAGGLTAPPAPAHVCPTAPELPR
jgi:hypothetical protein